ncbi:MAG: two-component system chemotaxis family response regulator CheB [Rhodospirillaceae bacterium]|nr:MAG: two-component system chemotaxis family response regulator CheB [Rhodospirillaceae bacterium]
MTAGRKIKVLVVDDSATVRETLTALFSEDSDLTVLGAAADPYGAARLIAREVPDVIVLDIEMPRMDSLTFLRKLMEQRPVPVVICSSLVEEGAETWWQALEAGAVEVILKPRLDTRQFLFDAKVQIGDAVKAAAQARLRFRSTEKKLSADAVLPPPRPSAALARTTETVVCVGASTGGTEAVRILLEALPADAPGLAIVQHMPEGFTAAFARRLNASCAITVREARSGDPILRGQALIAPGNHHLLVQRNGARYAVAVREGPLVARHRPSVDVLFRSAVRAAGANAVGVLMTGMGDDGARGLLEMRAAGAYTVAEDESSCVVFGMPREAIRLGAACTVVPLERLAAALLKGGLR